MTAHTSQPAGPAPSEVLPGLIQTVSEAAAGGQTLRHLEPDAKELLARLGYVTTAVENPNEPPGYAEYHAEQNRRRMLGRLVVNSEEAMAEVPLYDQAREDDTLGLTMAYALTTARATRHRDVHFRRPVTKKDGTQDGVITARNTTVTFSDEDDSALLHTMLQGMLGKDQPEHVVHPRGATYDWQVPPHDWHPDWAPPFKLDADCPQPPRFEVYNLNEYRVRVVGEAIGTMAVRELGLIGVRLPAGKDSLQTWLKQGETFHPEIRAWLAAIDATYNQMHESGFVAADYRDQPEGFPPRRAHIIGTDVAPILKAWRDGFNWMVNKYRGGDSRYNKEQDPIRRMRLPIEKGVGLKRPKPPEPGEEYEGPALARPLNLLERAVVTVQETWEDVKARPRGRLPELLGEAVGKAMGGVGDLVISAGVLLFKAGDAIVRGVKNHREDRRSWREEQRLAHERLGVIAGELQALHESITSGAQPDEFPENTLEPSPQLAVIQRMTALMLSRLATAPPRIP